MSDEPTIKDASEPKPVASIHVTYMSNGTLNLEGPGDDILFYGMFLKAVLLRELSVLKERSKERLVKTAEEIVRESRPR
jgi:hypothetical protein